MKVINLDDYTFYIDNISVTGGYPPNHDAKYSDWDFYGEKPELSFDVVDVTSSLGWLNEDCEYVTPTDADKNAVIEEYLKDITEAILSNIEE